MVLNINKSFYIKNPFRW